MLVTPLLISKPVWSLELTCQLSSMSFGSTAVTVRFDGAAGTGFPGCPDCEVCVGDGEVRIVVGVVRIVVGVVRIVVGVAVDWIGTGWTVMDWFGGLCLCVT